MRTAGGWRPRRHLAVRLRASLHLHQPHHRAARSYHDACRLGTQGLAVATVRGAPVSDDERLAELIENMLNKCYCAGSSHGLCEYCRKWTDYYRVRSFI